MAKDAAWLLGPATLVFNKIRFSSGLRQKCTIRIQQKNHYSGLAFPNDIEEYINEEISFGAIHGPFEQIPIPNLHVSPSMTRGKAGAAHWRVIMELSFP